MIKLSLIERALLSTKPSEKDNVSELTQWIKDVRRIAEFLKENDSEFNYLTFYNYCDLL